MAVCPQKPDCRFGHLVGPNDNICRAGYWKQGVFQELGILNILLYVCHEPKVSHSVNSRFSGGAQTFRKHLARILYGFTVLHKAHETCHTIKSHPEMTFVACEAEAVQ